MEWEGGSIRHRKPTPPEWPRCPGGAKNPKGPQGPRADRGGTDGGGEETKTHPPPDQLGRKEPTAVKAT